MTSTSDSEYFSSTESDDNESVEYDTSSTSKQEQIDNNYNKQKINGNNVNNINNVNNVNVNHGQSFYNPSNNYLYRPISSIKSQYSANSFYSYTGPYNQEYNQYNSFNQQYNPYNQQYNPYNQQYNPYNQQYNPYNQQYNPCNQQYNSYNDYNNTYDSPQYQSQLSNNYFNKIENNERNIFRTPNVNQMMNSNSTINTNVNNSNPYQNPNINPIINPITNPIMNTNINPSINQTATMVNNPIPVKTSTPDDTPSSKRDKISPFKRRRKAAIKPKEIVEIIEEEEIDEFSEPEDPYEKLLKYDPVNERYYVKFRYKSYLHCDWVDKKEIAKTKVGLMKIKRYRIENEYKHPKVLKIEVKNDNEIKDFKNKEIENNEIENKEIENKDISNNNINNDDFNDNNDNLKDNNEDINNNDEEETYYFDPELIKVERIITIDRDEDGKKIFLIKWGKIPYEMSTFEFEDHVKDLEGFDEEFINLKKRYTTRISKLQPGWRPSKEHFIKFVQSPEFLNGNKLRSYQLEGLNWLLNRWYYRQGCIMADEMGLGKTVQSVSLVQTVFSRYGYPGPVMVVAPLSTIIHWEREFKNWTNLRVLMFHGSQLARDLIYKYEFYSPSKNYLFDVLITTYEMVMGSQKQLSEINFTFGIFDEAHRLKNPNSKAVLALKNINFEHKVLLSGTPLQNNLTELWSLLNFIDPIKYQSVQNFLQIYKLENCDDVERLQTLLKPIMLRRMKDDVENIPAKEETIIEVELTMIQKRFYRAILEKNLNFLRNKNEHAPNLLNAMMELRKCCIHPYLISGAEEKILGELNMNFDYLYQKSKSNDNINDANKINIKNDKININDDKININDDNQINNDQINIYNQINNNPKNSIDDYYRVLIQSSGKLVLLDKLLNKLKNGHKVLIFSQMTRCLDLLSDYLNYRKYKFERIDGSVRGDHRQAAIDRFTADKDIFVFLLCTRAGGVGINLTAADTVVIFDSDWNPQNDLQAQARCHRIGQTNEVKIYRLVTRNTYEREMFDKASLKLGLDRAILTKTKVKDEIDQNDKSVDDKSIDDDEFKDESLNLSKKDAIEILLKKGAYGVLMETDDVSQKFCEEDIDQILERRTKIVKHTDLYNKGNIFSKATFQVDEEIDDPFFWDNLLSKKKLGENEGKIKRQIRRLARDGEIDENVDKLLSDVENRIQEMKWYLEKVKKCQNGDKSDKNKNLMERNKNIDEDEFSSSSSDSLDEIKPHMNDLVAELETQVDILKEENFNEDKFKDDEYNNKSNDDKTNDSIYYKILPQTKIDDLYLLIFLKTMKNGIPSLKNITNIQNPYLILNQLIFYCQEILDSKVKDDFMLYMTGYKNEIVVDFNKENEVDNDSKTNNDSKINNDNKINNEEDLMNNNIKTNNLTKKYNFNINNNSCDLKIFKKISDPFFLKYTEIYKKYYQKFLLRIQIIKILENLSLKSTLTEEEEKIINLNIENGYDNYKDEFKKQFKVRNNHEFNQRVRKIVLKMNKEVHNRDNFDEENVNKVKERNSDKAKVKSDIKKDIKNDNKVKKDDKDKNDDKVKIEVLNDDNINDDIKLLPLIDKIFIFGKPTEFNKDFFDDVNEAETEIKKIKKMRKSRRVGKYTVFEVLKRVELFDKLLKIYNNNIKNNKKKKNIKSYLKTNNEENENILFEVLKGGISDGVLKIYNTTEELIVQRLEKIVGENL
ncbi:Chromodomain-helicase-DNA-binding protein 9 [Dictyocoela muelleri]|nr:Chromodomain-helicase-DNA-binding protein 9 [Dictyocoela muelleri]